MSTNKDDDQQNSPKNNSTNNYNPNNDEDYQAKCDFFRRLGLVPVASLSKPSISNDGDQSISKVQKIKNSRLTRSHFMNKSIVSKKSQPKPHKNKIVKQSHSTPSDKKKKTAKSEIKNQACSSGMSSKSEPSINLNKVENQSESKESIKNDTGNSNEEECGTTSNVRSENVHSESRSTRVTRKRKLYTNDHNNFNNCLFCDHSEELPRKRKRIPKERCETKTQDKQEEPVLTVRDKSIQDVRIEESSSSQPQPSTSSATQVTPPVQQNDQQRISRDKIIKRLTEISTPPLTAKDRLQRELLEYMLTRNDSDPKHIETPDTNKTVRRDSQNPTSDMDCYNLGLLGQAISPWERMKASDIIKEKINSYQPNMKRKLVPGKSEKTNCSSARESKIKKIVLTSIWQKKIEVESEQLTEAIKLSQKLLLKYQLILNKLDKDDPRIDRIIKLLIDKM